MSVFVDPAGVSVGFVASDVLAIAGLVRAPEDADDVDVGRQQDEVDCMPLASGAWQVTVHHVLEGHDSVHVIWRGKAMTRAEYEQSVAAERASRAERRRRGSQRRAARIAARRNGR